MSRDLLRLLLAQKSIWQYGTTFYYFLEVAVIVIVMRQVGTSFLAGPFKYNLLDRNETRKSFDKGTGYKIPFIYSFNKLFNKARAQMSSRSSRDMFGCNFFDWLLL